MFGDHAQLLCIAKIEEVDTAFESSEFRLLVLEASDDSLNLALELFNVPGAVNVNLRGRPPAQPEEEVITYHAIS